MTTVHPDVHSLTSLPEQSAFKSEDSPPPIRGMASRSFPVCDPRMPGPTPDEPQRLRQLATQLRENAFSAAWPGYTEKLIQAAEELERRAVEIESSLFLPRKRRPADGA
jgi:hypothetical protein